MLVNYFFIQDKVDSGSAIESVLNGGKPSDKRKQSAKSSSQNEAEDKKSEVEHNVSFLFREKQFQQFFVTKISTC